MIATPISREALLTVVKTLPASPLILAQLGRLLLDMNSDLKDITELLKRDAALTARIIRISNSALYNTGKPFASIEESLARVGYTEVYRLAGFAAVAQIADQNLAFYGISGTHLRENSLLNALIMEALARPAKLDPRMAYTAGLLRSTGKIALDRLARGSFPGNGYEAGGTGGLADWETGFVGLDNCSAASVILGEWRFSDETIEAIRDHYLLTPAEGRLAHVLNIAAGETERTGHGLPGEARYWEPAPEKFTAARLDPGQLAPAVARALETFHAVRAAVA